LVDEKGVQEDLKQAEQEEQLRAPAEEAPAETPVEGGEEAPEETTREEEGAGKKRRRKRHLAARNWRKRSGRSRRKSNP